MYTNRGSLQEILGHYNAITLKGDLKVNIQDVQTCINHILGTQDWGVAADVNNDGAVNVLDVQEIVNIILGV
ncbi:MAG: dockerin type I domain-containing protein [Candidatus Altiarchaeota archaeon]|nr:dockerin type I domain-containing protein [Candidatus Altiarchaeota archaeon]